MQLTIPALEADPHRRDVPFLQRALLKCPISGHQIDLNSGKHLVSVVQIDLIFGKQDVLVAPIDVPPGQHLDLADKIDQSPVAPLDFPDPNDLPLGQQVNSVTKWSCESKIRRKTSPEHQVAFAGRVVS